MKLNSNEIALSRFERRKTNLRGTRNETGGERARTMRVKTREHETAMNDKIRKRKHHRFLSNLKCNFHSHQTFQHLKNPMEKDTQYY